MNNSRSTVNSVFNGSKISSPTLSIVLKPRVKGWVWGYIFLWSLRVLMMGHVFDGFPLLTLDTSKVMVMLPIYSTLVHLHTVQWLHVSSLLKSVLRSYGFGYSIFTIIMKFFFRQRCHTIPNANKVHSDCFRKLSTNLMKTAYFFAQISRIANLMMLRQTLHCFINVHLSCQITLIKKLQLLGEVDR